MKARRRILILDDEAKVAFFLRETLEAVDRDFEVVSVSSTEEALKEIERKKFDLLVTDQRMPGMTGLELVGKVQERYPEMQFILITAYGSEDVFDKAQRLGAYRYFSKPFHIEDFVQTVVDALEDSNNPSTKPPQKGHMDVLSSRLEELRREVGAQCVLASTTGGALAAQAGAPVGLDMEKLLQLTADHFSTSLALADYLGGAHVGNLSYYEGTNHDVYTANVDGDLFLVIVFDRRVQASRIGIVWLYARRAIENLRRIRMRVP
jgi:CheY-like chemotaxis protein/predicted regulator of Ras-like GTPase activity (Roadblock/LC7/MglB family)